MAITALQQHIHGSIFTADSTYAPYTDSRGVTHVLQTHGLTPKLSNAAWLATHKTD